MTHIGTLSWSRESHSFRLTTVPTCLSDPETSTFSGNNRNSVSRTTPGIRASSSGPEKYLHALFGCMRLPAMRLRCSSAYLTKMLKAEESVSLSNRGLFAALVYYTHVVASTPPDLSPSPQACLRIITRLSAISRGRPVTLAIQ